MLLKVMCALTHAFYFVKGWSLLERHSNSVAMLKSELRRIAEKSQNGLVEGAVGRTINVGQGVDVYLLVDISGSISEDSFNKTKKFLKALISKVRERRFVRFIIFTVPVRDWFVSEILIFKRNPRLIFIKRVSHPFEEYLSRMPF